MLTTLGFDADDTLWHHENIFRDTHAAFARLLAKWHDAATVERHLSETERRNLDLYGYGVKGFTLSALETALNLSRGEISPREIRAVINQGKAMLSHPVELIEGAAETLAALAPHYRLLLITKGDLRDQERKIGRSGLADFFAAHEIVSEKHPGTYLRILQRHNVAPEQFLMVGNSVKSDILPVLEIGGAAVHIPYRFTWSHEAATPPQPGPRFQPLTSLSQLPDLLARGFPLTVPESAPR